MDEWPCGWPRTVEGRALLIQVAQRIARAEAELAEEGRMAGGAPQARPVQFSPAERALLAARGLRVEEAEHRLRTSGI